MLQKINPTLANDPGHDQTSAAEGREQAFRNELRTKGFPDFDHLKCSFVAKTQIAPGLVELDAALAYLRMVQKSSQDLLRGEERTWVARNPASASLIFSRSCRSRSHNAVSSFAVASICFHPMAARSRHSAGAGRA